MLVAPCIAVPIIPPAKANGPSSSAGSATPNHAVVRTSTGPNLGAAKPAVVKPTAGKLSTDKPAVVKPTAGKLSTDKSAVTAKHEAGKRDAGKKEKKDERKRDAGRKHDKHEGRNVRKHDKHDHDHGKREKHNSRRHDKHDHDHGKREKHDSRRHGKDNHDHGKHEKHDSRRHNKDDAHKEHKTREITHPRHVIKPQALSDNARNVVSGLLRRSDDEMELYRRETEDLELVIREFDELMTREPFFGKLWRKVKHYVTVKNIKEGIDLAKSLKGRELSPELEALAAREPLVDALLKTVKEASAPEKAKADAKPSNEVKHEDNPDMYVRDVEELDARDPFLNSFWKKAKPILTRKNFDTASGLIRTFTREENPEVFERDYEIDELD